ncbi:MAG: formylmethanofuran--tetrahydromethanopterin N-formyltransferase [Mariniblastus sp.]|nr:formylmethanofuran--tetrahydromethanopterin N-formyltransferase [Mariniblastus sp.]
MKVGPTFIEDTFAEAFSMRFCRIIVTAFNQRWLNAAISEFCGYGSSVIGCDAEVGLEQLIDSQDTLDGRPGASLMLFGFSTEAVQKAVVNRTGQCLMTCPTTAVFDGMQESTDRVPLGKHLRFFGDGFQKSKLIGERRFWRVPVMDGEFIVEESVGVNKGVAGGNFLILSRDQTTGLHAAERSVDQITKLQNVITPFPGGVVRSGSKVGSKYKDLRASTAHAFCPSLRGRVESKLPEDAGCVYEIVIDGSNFEAVAEATRSGIKAAVGEGIISISAGNYGGKLGKHHFQLRHLLSKDSQGANKD